MPLFSYFGCRPMPSPSVKGAYLRLAPYDR